MRLFFYALCRQLLPLAAPAQEGSVDVDLAALFAALLFAAHPLRVESVAWVTERRDVLSGAFYLTSLLLYVRRRRPWPALFFYALGLLSKAIGVALPLVFVLLDLFPLGRLPLAPRRWLDRDARGVWLEKIPFLALALALGVIGAIGQKQVGATLSLQYYGILPRVAQAFYGPAFYLWKTIWPANLMPLYEELHPVPWEWPFWPAAVFVVLATAAALRFYRRWPAGVVLWGSYLLGLLPVLGFVKFGQGIAADRYTYLACLSWAALGGGILLHLLDGASAARRQVVLGGAGIVCAALCAATWLQTSAWHDSESLWKHTLAINPHLEFIQNNLGTALAEKGKDEEAMEHYRTVLSMNSKSKFGHYNLGNSLYKLGRRREAIMEYSQALSIDGGYFPARRNLSAALLDEGIDAIHQGHLPQAVAAFGDAARLMPDNVNALNNLGAALSDAGHFDQAVTYFQAALRVDPRCVQAQTGWGTALFKRGDAAGAIDHYRAALAIDPRLVEAHANLAVVLGGKAAWTRPPTNTARSSKSLRTTPRPISRWATSWRRAGVLKKRSPNTVRRCACNRSTPARARTWSWCSAAAAENNLGIASISLRPSPSETAVLALEARSKRPSALLLGARRDICGEEASVPVASIDRNPRLP